MRFRKIPEETIKRLPTYLRGILFISQQGHHNVSSRELADYLGTNSWQIRKDFSYFGDFGTPGVGYDTKKLIQHIKKILKLDIVHKAALVGVGNLGSAVLAYQHFDMYGLAISAAFDTDPVKIGKKINNVRIEDASKISSLKKRKINIGIIAVPLDAAKDTTDALVKAGVKAILNFSPCNIIVPKKVKVITIDIAMDLARLPYYL